MSKVEVNGEMVYANPSYQGDGEPYDGTYRGPSAHPSVMSDHSPAWWAAHVLKDTVDGRMWMREVREGVTNMPDGVTNQYFKHGGERWESVTKDEGGVRIKIDDSTAFISWEELASRGVEVSQ